MTGEEVAKKRSIPEELTPDSAPRNEADAVAELRKLLMDISGAAITSELSRAMRDRAENIFQAFPSSTEVSDVYRRILIAAHPAPVIEPESCRMLREKLNGLTNAKTIVSALKASGFYRNNEVASRELDCFRNIIHGALQTLRASNENTEGVSPDRIKARLESLREVLDALPARVEGPRDEVSRIIYQLELKSARARFVTWSERLNERVELQDFADLDRGELKTNLWAHENPTAPEVVQAQIHLARLEELHHAFQTQTAEAERVRDLIDSHDDYDQALNEARLTDTSLQEIGLRNRKPLDSVLDHLVDKLEEIYMVQERVVADPAPAEAMLEASLSNLGRIGVQLQKVPDSHKARTAPLYRKSSELTELLAGKLNNLRLDSARKELRNIPLEKVPAYIDQLRLLGLQGLSEWSVKVQLVWEALSRVSQSHGPVDSIYLARLENAEGTLGPSPLTQAAKEAVQEWRDAAARDYLWKSVELVEALESVALDHVDPKELAEAISEVIDHVVQYGKYQESELFSETQSKYPADYKSLDQRVAKVCRNILPEAVRRWAKLAVQSSSSPADITAARQWFVAWQEVPGIHLPQAEIGRVFDERSAEMEIRALVAAGELDEGLKVIEDKNRVLSPGFILEFTRLLRRRKASATYEPGHEAEIAEAIKEYGPDSDLLWFLVDDFAKNGQCDHLAAIYGCIKQIEALDPHAARLVQWAFEFKSGLLQELAQSLATSNDIESVLTFANGLTNSIHHASALRVLQLTLKEPGILPVEIRTEIKAASEILRNRFDETISKIEDALNDLIERCQSDEQTVTVSESPNDALLLQQIEEAFVRAQGFLNSSLASVENWLSYLTTAARFEVELDPTLRKKIQELDVRLGTNAQLLDRLATARRAVESHGWMRLEDLRKALTVLTITVPPVAAVIKLLNRYLEDYRPTTEVVGELTEAWKNEGVGLSSTQLTNLINRLTVELKYDIRTGQDRFRQLQRLSGRTFNEFIDELKLKVSEVEAVGVYQERLLSAMTGKEDLLRLRLERNLQSDRQAVWELLRQPDSLGQSMLYWYSKLPDISHSSVAKQRLQELQNLPWFELLRKAVTLTEESGNTESTRDLSPDV